MGFAAFRAKLGKIESTLNEVEREVAAEVGPRKAEPKAPKAAAPKAQPKAETQPKAAKVEAPAEPVVVAFKKDFRLEAELQPEGLVGKKSPRAKFQAEGLDLGTEGAEGKIYAYFPVGKEIPATLVASFAGESRGSKAIFQAEMEDGVAVYIYLPVRHVKSNELDLELESTKGGVTLTATKHRNGAAAQPKAEKAAKATKAEPKAPKAKAKVKTS